MLYMFRVCRERNGRARSQNWSPREIEATAAWKHTIEPDHEVEHMYNVVPMFNVSHILLHFRGELTHQF
jgi:hypothetical protein